jgi:hypothetical protein
MKASNSETVINFFQQDFTFHFLEATRQVAIGDRRKQRPAVFNLACFPPLPFSFLFRFFAFRSFAFVCSCLFFVLLFMFGFGPLWLLLKLRCAPSIQLPGGTSFRWPGASVSTPVLTLTISALTPGTSIAAIIAQKN